MCNKTCVNVTSAVFCAIGLLLFMIGACGNTEDEDILQDVPWGAGEIGSSDIWLGTSALYVDGSTEAIVYSDCQNDFDDDSNDTWCDDCKSSGTTALALTCVALILAVVGLVCNILAITGKKQIVVKVGALVSTLISSGCAIVAFIVYRACIQAVVDAAIFNTSIGYGAAAWMVLIGFLVMFIAAILNTINMCLGDGNAGGSGTSSL